jgi:hypothetical protein
MIQNTSLESFISILPELGELQNIVYDCIKTHPSVCNHELSCILNKPINSITPRVKELRDLNLVYCVGTKKDRLTNRNVMIWRTK